MEQKDYSYRRVGYLKNAIALSLGVKFTGTIYASSGVIKHIKKRHGDHLNKRVIENLFDYMKEIIENPDYIGVFKEGENYVNVEFIKKIDDYILIGIYIEENGDYISVSTMYPISEKKIYNKLYSGKLFKCI